MIRVTKTKLPKLEEYYKYLETIWRNNWITNSGELSQKLEKDLIKYLEVNNLALVSNGTISLQIILKSMGLKGEVITTPFTFPATTNAILWEGLQPVYADIDPNTFNIDPKEIENRITKKTSAILAVHVFGNACDVEKIRDIGKKYKIKVIYDSAHAFGVKYKGKSLLKWGDANSLSFHATKIFHTAEGGAIITKNKGLYNSVCTYRNHGIANPYNFIVPGTNAKLNELQAAMGLCMLPLFKDQTRKRKKIYQKYDAEFSKFEQLKLQKFSDHLESTYPYFPVVFTSEVVRDRVYKESLKVGIEPRKYFYPPCNEFPYVNSKTPLHNSTRISHSILCLPLYSDLSEEETDKIISVVVKYGV
jgi:dTDP-4-amino-4,6-dideoxygalactose transaminase